MSLVPRTLARIGTPLLLLLGLAIPSVGQPNYNPSGGRRPTDRAPESAPAQPATPQAEPAEPVDLLGNPVEAPVDPALLPPPPPLAADAPILGMHTDTGEVRGGGSWTLDSTFAQDEQVLNLAATLTLKSSGLWYWLPQTKGLYLVVLAERIFDGQGTYSYGASGIGTTVLTPTGMPVVAGAVANPTDAFGGSTRHPGNRFLLVAPTELERQGDQETVIAHFNHVIPVGEELPAGWYRFIIQSGVQLSDREFTTLMGANPAELVINSSDDSVVRFPLTAVKAPLPPVIPATLFAGVHPGGGALPDELLGKVGLTARGGFAPKTILPPLGPDGGQIQYDLGVTLPWLQGVDDSRGSFPLELNPAADGNHYTLALTTPDETILNLGDARITGINDGALESDRTNGRFAFSRYGKHLVVVDGALTDTDGIVYRIGGNYTVWIAKPLDLRVATLPGMPGYENERAYLATRCYPPVPAKITYTYTLGVHGSDKTRRKLFDGWANSVGEYVPELKFNSGDWWGEGQAIFENDGEYRISAEAIYGAPDGTLYLGQWESANVVLPPRDGTQDKDRSLALPPAFGGLGATTAPAMDGTLDFPFASGDLLAIAPGPARFDPLLYGRGDASLIEQRLLPATNLVDLTSGERGFLPGSGTPQGYPASGYPEHRDRLGHLYAWAVGPGLPTRMVVRDGRADGVREADGPTLPWHRGDAYTLFGGVALWDSTLEGGAQGSYTGALVVSDQVNTFRVVGGGEDLASLIDRQAPYLRHWAIPAGSIVDQFRAYTPECHVFPPTTGSLSVTLRSPKGTEEYFTAEIDSRGLATGRALFTRLQDPGVYTVVANATLGGVLSAPPSFQFYVPDRKTAFTIALDQQPGTPVSFEAPFTLSGNILGEGYQQAELYYTATMDGEVLTQGHTSLIGPSWSAQFDLPKVHDLAATFDPHDPAHLGDLTVFAVVLTAEGELKTAHTRATIRHGQLEWVDQTKTDDDKPFWKIW